MSLNEVDWVYVRYGNNYIEYIFNWVCKFEGQGKAHRLA